MAKGLGLPTYGDDDPRSHHEEKVKVRGSTAIHRIDYTDQEVLVIYMVDGSKLEYGNVPRSVFNEFLKADSKGRFFNLHIRNTYSFLS